MVTIHDIQPLDLPDNFSTIKQRYLAWALPRTVRHATMIATPSQWVADRLIDRLNADPDRVRVVSSVADPVMLRGVPDPQVASLGDRPVMLYAAITHPHKNHSVLIAAMRQVINCHPESLLIFTGTDGAMSAEVADQIRDVDPDGRFIRHLGRVEAGTLAALTARADLVVFPSTHEGFGLPVLEAMQRGTPVVAADCAAVPEVLGGAGVLLAPHDVEAWADAISSLLDDDDRRAGLAVAGTARAATYSPAQAGDVLAAVWRDATA